MSILNRLGNVLKSYLNDGTERTFRDERSRPAADDDLNAAYEELEDYLKNGAESGKKQTKKEKPYNGRPIPPEIKKDFEELGLSPGVNEEECKEAYKKLLKIHHPDRHGGNQEMMKKATEKTARINASYDRLVNWFRAYG